MAAQIHRAIRRALALLECASADWRHKGPSDGSAPLYWPLAVGAAKAHLGHALTELNLASPDAKSQPDTDDTREGMAWWNALTRPERAEWLRRADSAVPADAWAAYKAASAAKEVSACKPA